jgi:membrane-associated phospholipid phosphatase
MQAASAHRRMDRAFDGRHGGAHAQEAGRIAPAGAAQRRQGQRLPLFVLDPCMSLRPLTIFVTSFGGQGVILPILLLVTGILLISGQRRAAVWWAFSVALVLGVILVAKIAFIPCGRYLGGLDLRSPSGHAGASMAVYGGLAVLVARLARSRALAGLALLCGFGLALAIAVTRVVLGAHSLSETILGGAIGLIAPLFLASRPDLFVRPVRLKWIWLLVAPVIVVALLHGVELGAESVIERIARELNAWLGVCR